MNNDRIPSPLDALPPAFAHSPYGMHLQKALGILEDALKVNALTHTQDNILLLLEQSFLADLTMIAIERFMRSMQFQRILLLVDPKRKARVIEIWEQAFPHDTGFTYKNQFSMTSTSLRFQEAQVCIATTIDIQHHVEIDPLAPFFQTFDAILLYEVPINPGPVWTQIVELFLSLDASVIGLSSLLSQEDGALRFERVIEMRTSFNEREKPM